MCLGIPAQVVEVGETSALVEIGGVRREVPVTLLDDVAIGDWLIVHAGYAIQRLDEAEATEILETLSEYFAAAEREGSAI